jgi:hypothetical protein
MNTTIITDLERMGRALANRGDVHAAVLLVVDTAGHAHKHDIGFGARQPSEKPVIEMLPPSSASSEDDE